MGILSGHAPWIVYWVLVGNVPFAVAAVLALVVAVAPVAMGRIQRMSLQPLEIGAVSTFLVLTVLTFALSAPALERWLLPLSNAGLLAVALTDVLTGKQFVPDLADAGRRSSATGSFRRFCWQGRHSRRTASLAG